MMNLLLYRVTNYDWKCNFPLNPYARLLVGLFVGCVDGWLVGWIVG